MAAFLDFSLPAREAALGGNGVALPEGTSSLLFNPAGLGDQNHFEVSARYENLFSGIEGDNLSTGNLSAVFPLEVGDSLGLSVDHFGAMDLQQDRVRAAFGKSFGAKTILGHLRFGVSLSYLRQQFTLPVPLPGLNPANVSAGSFSVGAGVLYDPVPWATLGFSAEDLNQPNLGVVGVDMVPILTRYGVSVRPPVGEDQLALTLTQTLNGSVLATQGGAEWSFTRLGVAVRAGGDANSGVVGVGWRNSGLTIDYAYEFSWNEAPSLGGVGLPGSHLLEIGFSWENISREGRVFQDLVFRGQQALKDQRWKDAYWYYQQAYLLRPSEPAVLDGREKALGQYNRMRAESYFNEGVKAEEKGYLLEAQRDYEWASSLGPQEYRYALARDRVKKSLTQGALGDPRVQKLLEKFVSLVKKGENAAALKRVKEARGLYPNDAFLDFMAKSFARKAIAAAGHRDEAVDRMTVEAEIYRSKGRMDLAKETWFKILKADPGNPMATENLSDSDKDGSSGSLTEAQKNQARLLLQKGMKAYVNGDVETAVANWEEVLKIDPHNVNALNNLTRVKMEEGRDHP